MLLPKIKPILRLILGSAMLTGLVACGGQASPVATTEVKGEVAATSPAESAPTVVSETAAKTDAPTPATVAEAAKAIDLRKLTLPEDVTMLGAAEVGTLQYQTAENVVNVVKTYQAELTKQGWVEDTTNSHVDPTSTGLYFTKNGFTLNLSVSDMGDGKAMVGLVNSGNVDLRTLPQMTDAEQVSAFPNTLIYFSPSDVKTVADFTRKALKEAGWQIYTRPNTASDPNQPQQIFNLKQHGMDLNVMISSAPAQAGKTAVQYNTVLLPFDLPIPAEVNDLQFDATSLFASFRTNEKFETISQFYQTELAALGWVETTKSAFTSEEKVARFFTHEAEQLALLMELTLDDGQTVATLRSFDASELAATTPTAEPTIEATPTDEPTAEAATTTDSAPSASSFPLPTEAQDVSYQANEITFNTPADVKTMVEFYRKTLKADGWEEDSLFSVVEQVFGMLRFKRGEEALSFNMMNTGVSGLTEVTVDISEAHSYSNSSDDNATPAAEATSSTDTGSEVSGPLVAEDKEGLPVPKGYSSYSSEGSPFSRKVNVSIATDMKSLFDFYEKELAALGWKVGDIMASTFEGTLNATGPDGVLNLTAKQADDEIEVVLMTKNKDAATKAGILPAAGQSRVYMINPSEGEVTIKLNEQEFNLAAGSGMDSPESASKLDLAPNKYTVTAIVEGQESTLEITLAADEVWTLLAGPGGLLPSQMY